MNSAKVDVIWEKNTEAMRNKIYACRGSISVQSVAESDPHILIPLR